MNNRERENLFKWRVSLVDWKGLQAVEVTWDSCVCQMILSSCIYIYISTSKVLESFREFYSLKCSKISLNNI